MYKKSLLKIYKLASANTCTPLDNLNLGKCCHNLLLRHLFAFVSGVVIVFQSAESLVGTDPRTSGLLLHLLQYFELVATIMNTHH